MSESNPRHLRLLHQRTIAFQPVFVTMTGSINAAILLSQIMYWFEKKNTFYKTNADIIAETMLTEGELRAAKNKLKELSFISIELKGVPAKTYYNINWLEYEKALIQINSSSTDELTDLDALNSPNCVGEIHPTNTKTTSDISLNYNKDLENENVDDQQPIAKPELELTKQTKSKKFDDEFNQFWDAYSVKGIPSPKKGNRINAHKSFVKALRIITFDELMAALERYKKYVISQKFFGYKHASTWLNQSDWLTYPPEKTRAEVAVEVDWDLAVKTYKERGFYPAPGASPIDPRRCEAPTSVMIKYGYWTEVTA